MNKIFITSDTHFHHGGILALCPSREKAFGRSVDKMNEGIIKRWNATVRAEDVVYHLGDVGWFGNGDLSIINELNGHKVLLMGNHDGLPAHNYLKVFDNIVPSVYPIGFGGLVLSHVPLHPSSLGWPKWKLNVHGHIHERVIEDPRYFNACVEHHDFKPVDINEIAKLTKKIENIDLDAAWPDL